MSNFVTVQIFTSITEAHLAQLRLESNSIPCFLKDEITVGVVNLYAHALGGIQLQVEESDMEKATEILIEAGYIPKKDAPTCRQAGKERKIQVIDRAAIVDKTKCPYCGSENIDKVLNPSWWVIFFYLVLSAIFPIFKSWQKCYDCGKEWKYKKLSK